MTKEVQKVSCLLALLLRYTWNKTVCGLQVVRDPDSFTKLVLLFESAIYIFELVFLPKLIMRHFPRFLSILFHNETFFIYSNFGAKIQIIRLQTVRIFIETFAMPN